LGSLQAAVPLLVAALVLPLVVWALALAVRIWGPRILLSSAWVLVLLPLGTLGLVQLHDLQERVRLNETPLYYSFIDSFSLATHNSADPNLVGMRVWTVDGSTGRVLFAHPDLQSGHTRIEYTVDVPQDALVLSGVAMAPESWNQEGDGVQFSLYVEDEKGAHLLFERYLDPKHNPQDRAMYSFHTDLGEYAGPGRRFIFITDGGPQGDLRYDWAGWVEPRILSFARLAPSRPPPAGQGTPTATPLPTETPVPTATVTVSSGPQPTPLVTITPVPTGTVTPAARTSSPPYTSSVPR
jgi:hypothetical protein